MESLAEPVKASDESKEEYYKSLVTEEEVVAALIKDSKKRDGTLTPERMKPNLNFFQRTVSSVVSTNTKIDHNQDNFKIVYTKENEIELQVLQQIRLENKAKEASRSKKSAIDFEFEKDVFLRTSAVYFQKSNEPYTTVNESNTNDIEIVCSNETSNINNKKISNETYSTINEDDTNDMEIVCYPEPSTSKINPQTKNKKISISESPTQTETVLKNCKKSKRSDPGVTKDYLKKELEKIHKKIEKASAKQSSLNKSDSKKKVIKNTDKSTNLLISKGNKSNLSKEELLKLELAALNVKIQEKLSKMKKEDETILILDKEENGSDIEIVELNSSDDDVVASKNKDKKKTSKIKILQNIEITSSTTKAQDVIRNRMLSRIKKNNKQVEKNISQISDSSAFVCTKCGSCNSDILDKKPCTAVKCETIELSSSSGSDLELVSVKIEPKPKNKKNKSTIKKPKEKDKIKIVLNKTRTYKMAKSSPDKRLSRETRDYSSSSNSSRGSTREKSSDMERLDRDRQREDTYKSRKANFKNTVRNRTKSRDSHSRDRSNSRERRASFREKDKERSPSKDRRARSFSRFSTGTSYERYLDERNKSKSRSRSGSRSRRSRSKDSRQRESSTDSEQERYQAYMLAQQRFEERARREYWMNRIIREYQNRYRIPRIPQRHRLMQRRKEEPPAVQSKVVVVPKRERSSSSGSNQSRSRGTKSRSDSSDSSSSKGGKKRESGSETSCVVNLKKYNLAEASLKATANIEKHTIEEIVDQNVVEENSLIIPEKSLADLPEKTENVICGDTSDVSITADENSSKKKIKLDSNNPLKEEGELSDQKDTCVIVKKKKKLKKNKKEKKERKVKEKDKYVWRKVEISPNVTLHLGAEGAE